MAEIKYVSLDNLKIYDGKIKDYVNNADAAVKTELQGEITTVAGALDSEITRAKKAEEANAASVDALEAKVGAVTDGKTVVDMIAEAQTAATYDDEEVRNLISNLDTNKADKTQVAADIAAAVKVETDARIEAVAGVQGNVDTLSQTHATDKKTLEDAIALKADITTLNEVSDVANAAVKQADYDTKVAALEAEDTRIAGLVATEKARAEGVEAGLDERLVEVETFFKTTNGETLDTALDTLVEIQKYLDGEGEVADQMLLDIAANKKAIEEHVATDHDFAAADATLKSELESQIVLKADKTTVEGIDTRLTTVEGKVITLEGEMDNAEGRLDAVEAAVATKVEKEAYNTKIAALEDVDAGQETRLQALEAKFGGAEGSVEDQITDAKQEAIDTAASDATTKANAAEANAKTYADTLNTAMDTRVDALEADVHTHGNKALLDTYTQTESNLADAVSKKHVHNNFDILEAITAAKVAAWNAAEANAKTYADGLNTAMDTRVTSLETWHSNFTECSQEDINDLFA